MGPTLTFINFNVREEKKNPELLWNATIFVVVFTQDSTIAHSMPLWNNAVEFNVGFSCVFFFPTIILSSGIYIESNFCTVRFP